MTPKTVLFIGAISLCVSILGYALYHRDVIRTDLQKATMTDVWLIVLGSFAGTFVATCISMELLARHDSSIVSAVTYTAPMFVFMLSLVMLREKLDYTKLLGILVTTFGVVITTVGSRAS
jgi:drug/metabolite transporter (DMT)-like permease